MVIAVGWESLWLLAVSAYFCIAIHTYGKEFGIIHCFHRCCQESSNHEGSRGRAALSILTMSSFGSPFDFAYLEAPFCLSVCWVLHEHLRAKTKKDNLLFVYFGACSIKHIFSTDFIRTLDFGTPLPPSYFNQSSKQHISTTKGERMKGE